MDLNQYKEQKLNEIDYFFRGVNFDNIGKKDDQIVDKNLVIGEDVISLDAINKHKLWRSFAIDAFRDIRWCRIQLEKIYFPGLNEKNEIDNAVEAFMRKVMDILERLREEVLGYFYSKYNVSKEQFSFEFPKLNIFKIKLNDDHDLIDWNYGGNSITDANVVEVVDDLRVILFSIYVLPNIGEVELEKNNKFKLYKDEIIKLLVYADKFFVKTDLEKKELIKYYSKIMEIKNYDKVELLREQVISFISGISGLNYDELFNRIKVDLEEQPKESKIR